jgi:predicted glycosyltransferase
MASIWIDLDHAPHIPLFASLISGLKRRGHRPLVTVCDYGYTRAVIDREDIPYDLVGDRRQRNPVTRLVGHVRRIAALIRWSRGREIDVAISHGSRTLVIACALLRIPCVTMYDNESASTALFNRLSTKVLLPEVIPDDLFSARRLKRAQLVKYPGFKEEVYLGGFVPDSSLLDDLHVREDQTLVVLRPPASAAHHHSLTGEKIIEVFIERISAEKDAVGVLVPRSPEEGAAITKWIKDPSKFRLLTRPVNGLNLLWHADVVVGSGVTMNREASLMGVAAYGVFMGKIGTVERTLSERGRLALVRDVDAALRVPFVKRQRADFSRFTAEWKAQSASLVDYICDEVLEVAARKRQR